MATLTEPRSARGVTKASTTEELLTIVQFALRDAIDQYRDLTPTGRRAVVTSAAAFMSDLRAAGVRVTGA